MTEAIMEPRRRVVAWALALQLIVAASAAIGEEGQAPEGDGLDLYFRSAELGALSPQEQPLYGEEEPGDSQRIDRAFEGAPPQIPHTVEDMLPITRDSNECIDCHHPSQAVGEGEVPLPESHFEQAVMAAGAPGEGQVWKVKGYKKGQDVAPSRYNCSMCHAAQAVNVNTPASGFRSDEAKP